MNSITYIGDLSRYLQVHVQIDATKLKVHVMIIIIALNGHFFKDDYATTAGTVESWNNILKNIDHSQLRLRPDVFVRRQKQNIIGRQRLFYEQFVTSGVTKVIINFKTWTLLIISLVCNSLNASMLHTSLIYSCEFYCTVMWLDTMLIPCPKWRAPLLT